MVGADAVRPGPGSVCGRAAVPAIAPAPRRRRRRRSRMRRAAMPPRTPPRGATLSPLPRHRTHPAPTPRSFRPAELLLQHRKPPPMRFTHNTLYRELFSQYPEVGPQASAPTLCARGAGELRDCPTRRGALGMGHSRRSPPPRAHTHARQHVGRAPAGSGGRRAQRRRGPARWARARAGRAQPAAGEHATAPRPPLTATKFGP